MPDLPAPPPPLAAALASLWQATSPPDGSEGAVTPQRRGLDADTIVRAAIEVADESGLAALSMSRVAQRLGSGVMSLYRHVANKDELLLRMHDLAWRPSGTPTGSANESADGAASPAWRPALAEWCWEQHRVLREHPWLEGIRLSERAGTPSQFAWLERGLAILAGTALTENDKVDCLLMLGGFVFWEARLHNEAATAEGAAEFGVLIRAVIDESRFPALQRTIDAGTFDVPPTADGAGSFDFGLDRNLDGIAALMTKRQATERARF